MRSSYLSENNTDYTRLKNLYNLILIIAIVFLTGFFSAAHSQTMYNYCQIPPSVVVSGFPPNVLLNIDVSGSMGWEAYNYGGATYVSTAEYEGYFRPDKNYRQDSNNVWIETTSSASACPSLSISSSGTYIGKCLNWHFMSRIDLVRWAITSGAPASCAGGSIGPGGPGGGGGGGGPPGGRDDGDTFDPYACDPELWQEADAVGKVADVCDSTGCILLTSDGEEVKVPWSRVYDALAFRFRALALRPRLGVLFYSGSSTSRMRIGGTTGIIKEEVYIGDYTYSDEDSTLYPVSTEFPYMNLITNINSTAPEGGTPTGPAMEDSFNYFKQVPSVYEGFDPQTDATDKWRNPMYVCDEDPTDDTGGPSSNCVLVPCAENFVLLLSDGEWNSGIDPVKPSHAMHGTFTNVAPGVGVDTRVKSVYSIAFFMDSTAGGTNAMKHVAMYGAFDKTYNSYTNYSSPTPTWPDSLGGYPLPDSKTALTATSTSDWDSDSDDIPDTFYPADNASELKDAINEAILGTIPGVSSGTAVSVLVSGGGSGANLLHTGFYPKKDFEGKKISWIGTLQNLWFYLDPRLSNTSIREDTVSDQFLKLQEDRIVDFKFDETQGKTVADLYASDADGNKGTLQLTVELDELNYLWEAGSKLHSRDFSSDPRTIYTQVDGNILIDFGTGNADILESRLQASDVTEAQEIITYIRGDSDIDTSLYRDRTVTDDGTSAIWRLGDILNSTPKFISWIRLNNYDISYADSTYSEFLDSDAYKNRGKVIDNTVNGSGMVFAGANDGMLHAFRLGALEIIKDEDNISTKAALRGSDLGKEEWAFIPRNALPYLKYLMDKDYYYCHLYYVDATPFIFDASICPSCTGNYWDGDKDVDSWRTILIGGMRLGGGCRDTASTYGVQTPLSGEGYSSYFALDITDPASPSLLWEFSNPDLGFSTTGPSIIRINSRDFSVTPSVPDKTKNGRWFVVFGSGPTGPLSGGQFKGYSDQSLKLFILDLKTGTLLSTINTGIANAFGGSLHNASIDYDSDYQDDVLYMGYTKAEETPLASTTKWTQGGVLRLITKEDLNGAFDSSALNPGNWESSKVIEGDGGENIGAVTASIAHYARYPRNSMIPDESWLFFGTGRYFFKDDDASTQRMLFGIKDPCLERILGRPTPYTSTGSVCTDTAYTHSFCSDPYSTPLCGDIYNATITVEAGGDATLDNGWYINLESPANAQINSEVDSNIKPTAERVITNPLATLTGKVFFTTFAAPAGVISTDPCASAEKGSSYLWAVTYNRGSEAASTLYGKAFMPTSTGSIEQVNLRSAFTDKKADKGTSLLPESGLEDEGRRTGSIPGIPPAGQGLSIVVPPKPINEILHIQKK